MECDNCGRIIKAGPVAELTISHTTAGRVDKGISEWDPNYDVYLCQRCNKAVNEALDKAKKEATNG